MGDPLVLFLWVLSFFKCIGLSKTSHLWVLNLYLKRNLISDGWIPILDAEKSPEIPIFSGWNHHSYCFFFHPNHQFCWWNHHEIFTFWGRLFSHGQAAGLASHRVGVPGLELFSSGGFHPGLDSENGDFSWEKSKFSWEKPGDFTRNSGIWLRKWVKIGIFQ